MRKSNFTITHNIVSIVFMSSHTQQDLRPYLCYNQQNRHPLETTSP